MNLLEADELGEFTRYYVQKIEWDEVRYALVYRSDAGNFFVFDGYPCINADFGTSLMTERYWWRTNTNEEDAWKDLPAHFQELRRRLKTT